jgi:hypothetical protein
MPQRGTQRWQRADAQSLATRLGAAEPTQTLAVRSAARLAGGRGEDDKRKVGVGEDGEDVVHHLRVAEALDARQVRNLPQKEASAHGAALSR